MSVSPVLRFGRLLTGSHSGRKSVSCDALDIRASLVGCSIARTVTRGPALFTPSRCRVVLRGCRGNPDRSGCLPSSPLPPDSMNDNRPMAYAQVLSAGIRGAPWRTLGCAQWAGDVRGDWEAGNLPGEVLRPQNASLADQVGIQ